MGKVVWPVVAVPVSGCGGGNAAADCGLLLRPTSFVPVAIEKKRATSGV